MSEASSSCLRAEPRTSTSHALRIALPLVATLVAASGAHAQSWSAGRETPALWQIVALDRSGEAAWPFGAEDVAGDGAASFQADEASTDLRSMYADADASRLWLRAYVAAETEPPAAVRAFFFVDSDGQRGTGGPAYGNELDAALDRSVALRGFDHAIGVRGNGTLLGVWQWNAARAQWAATLSALDPQAVRAELGSALDPLRIGALNHGYLQVDVDHGVTMLSASCVGSLFVRVLHEGSPSRTFGDDALDAFACRAPADALGDPVVLRDARCDNDADCPADGRCRAGVCLFAYECISAIDCPAGQACVGNRCVHQVTTSCGANADCDGLVCQATRCVACSETGARVCANGLWCSPNGDCIDPDDAPAGGNPGGSAGPLEGKVQGGALICSASTAPVRSSTLVWAWLSALLAFGLHRRHVARAQSLRGVRS